MKKFLSIVLMVLLVMSPVMMVEAKTTTTTTTKATTKKSTKKTTTKKTTTEEASENKNPINIYVFYSSTCPHCSDLHEFLDKLKEDKTYGKMFKVVDYEVTSDSHNSDLMYEVVSHFKQTYDGVPIYVIGNQYMSGFAEDVHGDQVKEAIQKAYDEQPKDEIAELIQELANKKDGNAIGYIVLAVAVVIIIGVIYSSSKNKYYDDEVDSVDENEAKTVEIKNEKKTTETKKVESKKNDSKKTSSTTKKNSTKKKTTKKKA